VNHNFSLVGVSLTIPIHALYVFKFESGGHRYRFITPKSRHLQSSQLFNVASKQGGVREGIQDGAPVRVWNGHGEVALEARLSDDVRPGLVASYMVR